MADINAYEGLQQVINLAIQKGIFFNSDEVIMAQNCLNAIKKNVESLEHEIKSLQESVNLSSSRGDIH